MHLISFSFLNYSIFFYLALLSFFWRRRGFELGSLNRPTEVRESSQITCEGVMDSGSSDGMHSMRSFIVGCCLGYREFKDGIYGCDLI